MKKGGGGFYDRVPWFQGREDHYRPIELLGRTAKILENDGRNLLITVNFQTTLEPEVRSFRYEGFRLLYLMRNRDGD